MASSKHGEDRVESAQNYSKLADFEGKYRIPEGNKKSSIFTTYVKNSLRKFSLKRTVLQYIPILDTLIHYDVKENLPNDVICGLIVGIMMIPQGLAYAALSTLPTIVGLYLSFFSSITYFVFGTSRHLSWGCVAIVSLLMADVLYTYDMSDEGKAFVKSLNYSSSYPTSNSHLKLPSHYKKIFAEQSHAADYSNSSRDKHEQIIATINTRRIEIAGGTTVLSGLIFVAASQVGLSRITTIMSNSLITGFTVGIAFHVASSQIKEVFGISVNTYRGTGRLFFLWLDIIEHIPETNYVVFLLTAISIVVIYVVKKFVNERYKDSMRVPVPIELFVVIIGILVSSRLHLSQEHSVEIVGKVPVGIPKPKFPDLSLMTDYIGGALIVIIVAHAQSLAMAKTLGMEYNYPIDSKQEMFATGLSAFVCGVFSGYTPCASISRSLVQSGSGGKTQVASLVAAGLILLVIMVIGPLFYYLPTCIMSAIILVNVRGMFLKLLTIPSEWRKSRYDCCIWVFACLATIILDTGLALMVSVAFSVCLVIFRQVISPVVEVGKIQNSEFSMELRSLENYHQLQTIQHVKLVKVKNPLYFLNSESFTKAVFEMTQVNPIHVKSLRTEKGSQLSEKTPILKGATEDQKEILYRLENMKTLILELSEVSFMDVMGVQALEYLVCEYQSVGVHVLVSSVPENVFGILHSTGFWGRQKDRLFINVQAALDSLASEIDQSNVQDSKI